MERLERAEKATKDDRGSTPEPEVPEGRVAAEESGADAPRTRKGHGRIGAAAYPHARCTHVEHDRAHVGDTCPQCSHGRLYRLREPERIVPITGQPPLAAHTWEVDRLRCSGCGGVFTAPASGLDCSFTHQRRKDTPELVDARAMVPSGPPGRERGRCRR
jgi:DNA-directed RNA polymerase subunit RPC12/RpoP